MADFSFFLLLTTGLLTGFSHCAGMCGPLVGAFAMRRRAVKAEVSTALWLFQTGRLTTYTLLGLLLGVIGSLVDIAAAGRHWQGGVAVALGLLLTLMGLSLLGLLPVQSWLTGRGWGRRVSGWLKYWLTSPHPVAPFALGLANGLLPCGAVYAVGLLAAASGDAVKGATTMLVFGLGTLPAMLGVGLSVSLLGVRLRTGLYRLTAILVVLVGLQLALRGLAASGLTPHAVIGSVMLW
jgi:hypothetical protein